MEKVMESLVRGEMVYYDDSFFTNGHWLVRRVEGKDIEAGWKRPSDLTQVYQQLATRNLDQTFRLIGKVVNNKTHYAVYEGENGERRYALWKYTKLFRLRAIVADEEVGAPLRPNKRGLEFLALCRPGGLEKLPVEKATF